MADPIRVHDAKTHFSALLRRVEAGEEFVIARGQTPVARLVPVEKPARRQLGFIDFDVPQSFFEPLPEGELDAWQ